MKKLTFIIAAFCMPLLGHTSVPKSDLLDCAEMIHDQRRLECFDALVKKVQPDAKSEISEEENEDLPGHENWITSITTSPVDDSETVGLATFALETVSGRFNQFARPRLLLRCLRNTTSAYIDFDGLHMTDIQGYGQVTFRVDKRKAITRSTKVSTSNDSLGFWRGGNAIPFIKSLFGGETLLVQATPFNESRVTFSMDISGIEQAIRPLRKACNW